MAIQIPNPGTGNGQTGDNEFLLWSKVKSNFENATHAASRLVGTSNGNVVEIINNSVADTGLGGAVAATVDVSDAAVLSKLKAKGSHFFRIGQDTAFATRHSAGVFAKSFSTFAGISMSHSGAGVRAFAGDDTQPGVVHVYDLYHSRSTEIYATTTAAGANTVVDTTGKLMRSTSSERYKDILADLELDDAAYKSAMQLAPIVYRSTAEADNPDYHYYSFSAEKLGAFDPAFTLWRETETVTDDEGNTTEQPLAERVAEGININALLAFSHAIAIKQDKMIKAQAEAIETLTKRIDAMTAP